MYGAASEMNTQIFSSIVDPGNKFLMLSLMNLATVAWLVFSNSLQSTKYGVEGSNSRVPIMRLATYLPQLSVVSSAEIHTSLPCNSLLILSIIFSYKVGTTFLRSVDSSGMFLLTQYFLRKFLNTSLFSLLNGILLETRALHKSIWNSLPED
uniref:Uncharacterized protein n=1 Tax=Cacopsylla melanoneura TaxID=428564 RepID=A0A8D9E4J8_9HEMI